MEQVELTRDCDAIEIPAGTDVLTEGAPVVVTLF